VPKIIDYGGRFAFFELASFTLVRDHGVDRLSRHGLAKVLGTSISTVRRLLNPEADLRSLALNEVAVRRRARIGRRPSSTGVDAGAAMLAPLMPTCPAAIADELVWWRLAVAAPSTAAMPGDHEDEDGPLHHRFAIANHGFVPRDVLRLDIEAPRSAIDGDGEVDPVVLARQERHDDVAARLVDVVRIVDPEVGREEAERSAALLRPLVDGLGIEVCLGHLTPSDAVEIALAHLRGLLLSRPR
jgi:hypothetical protein